MPTSRRSGSATTSRVKADVRQTDRLGPGFALTHVGAGLPPLRRARLGLSFLGEGRRAAAGAVVQPRHRGRAARHRAEARRGGPWRGWNRSSSDGTASGPTGRRGEEIMLAARLISLADVVEVFHRAGGVEAAVAVAEGAQRHPVRPRAGRRAPDRGGRGLRRPRRGEQLGRGDRRAAGRSTWSSPKTELDAALEAIADFADLKSPWTIGHSRGVAELAEGAARAYGMPDADVVADPPRRRWCTTSAGSASRTRSGTSAGR